MPKKALKKSWRNFTPETFPFSVGDKVYYVTVNGVIPMYVRSLYSENHTLYKGGPVRIIQNIYLAEYETVWTRKITIDDVGECVFESEIDAKLRFQQNAKESEKERRKGLARIK